VSSPKFPLVAIRMLFGPKFCSAESCAVGAVVKGKLIVLVCREHKVRMSASLIWALD